MTTFTPWAGSAPTTPLTPDQRETIDRLHRASLAEAFRSGALTDSPDDWAAVCHEWTEATLAPAFAELAAFYAERGAA